MSGSNPSGLDRSNPSGLDMSIERSRGLERSGRDVSTSSAPWVPQISHEILQDLGMSDDAIAQYFCRFRHGQSEQFIQMALHKRGWMCRRWRGHMTKELYHGQKGIPH